MANGEENSAFICHNCFHINSAKAKFCSNCGIILALIQTEEKSKDFKEVFFSHSETFISKYDIIERIGEGGMSMVYKATQKNIQKIIAIKVLKASFLHDIDAIKRFHEEAGNAGALKHPNIISIYDEGEMDGIHFIAMEYLHGVDLHTYIQQKGILTELKFKDIFIQLADAIQYLENQKLTHRDIKSSNIFITNEGKPVLMDFGIASVGVLKQSNLYETNYGTPEYMSPEQINGEQIDTRSDLFSLGVVMFEALTGVLPFKGSVYADTLQKILHNEPPLHIIRESGASMQLELLVKKLLSKDPIERLQHGSEVISYISGKPIRINHFNFNDKLLRYTVYFLACFIFVAGAILLKPWDLYKSGKKEPERISEPPVQLPSDKGITSPPAGIKNDNQVPASVTPETINFPVESGNKDGGRPRQKRIRKKEDIATDYEEKGNQYYEKGDYTKAAENYKKASENLPDFQYYKDRYNDAFQKSQTKEIDNK